MTAFWFLAIVSMFNAIAHMALSLLVGGYFPGLISSPLVGVLGTLLARRLHRASSKDGHG
jgi:hypothetical protein